ncbi:phage major capsid protein [Actinomadura hibisca]|uniref:phage major capsid protein n=1 Tax=Actinomadura hibisca TaxID=68565 RepID=UPI000836A123|nr:phage major capsid protein [Actinomadura hibisca]
MGGTRKQIEEQLEQKKALHKRALEEADSGPGDEPDASRIKCLSGLTGREKVQQVEKLRHEIDVLETLLKAMDRGWTDQGVPARRGGQHKAAESGGFATGREWAQVVKTKLDRTAHAHGVKALTSGSIDTPNPLLPDVVAKPTNPARLVDLVVNRQPISGNEFEYLRQTVRTGNAAPVADGATKPTSVYTATPIEDRVRVIAHLSEAIPERILADHAEVLRWLEAEMYSGVVDAVETQLVSGSGSGENMTGILNTSGVGTQAFSSNIYQTLRKARTAMQLANENPNAVVLHPSDAETMDLTQTSDGAWLIGAGLGNILGLVAPIVSPSVPAGTALMGDWTMVRLVVREDLRLDADRSGELFETNQVKFRAEGRFGVAVLRPSAFTKITVAA